MKMVPRNPEFATYKLNEEGRRKALVIQDAFDVCLDSLTAVYMDSRSLSITRTKLEEACFFAKKAMALDLMNQEPIEEAKE